MKTKRTLAIGLSAVLAVSMSIPAFADNITSVTENNSASKDVVASYVGTTPIVYNVDVTWGNLTFTYNENGTNTWNPTTHQYELTSDATWNAVDDGNTISVQNHSNAAVRASFAYTQDTAHTTVTGSLDKTNELLAKAPVGGTTATDPKTVATLTLGGTMNWDETNAIKVGSVAITLTNGEGA